MIAAHPEAAVSSPSMPDSKRMSLRSVCLHRAGTLTRLGVSVTLLKLPIRAKRSILPRGGGTR